MSKYVPFISLQEQHLEIDTRLTSAIKRVYKKGRYILGDEVKAFEKEYAEFTGVRHCAATASGLDSLRLAFQTLGIGSGDEVIVPSNTCVPTWLAVTAVGARVVPVEPDPSTFNLDPQRVEAAITPHTKAVVPVHLFGQPCDMPRIMSVALKHNLQVVEDNAQAHGASHNGKMTGSFGIINATSFYPTKNLGAMGDSGAVTTNSERLHKEAAILRDNGFTERSIAARRGINSRLDELQAAILRVKLARLTKWNKERRRIASMYMEGLREIDDIILPSTIPGAIHVFHVFAIRTSKRDKLEEFLRTKNVETMVHYPVPPHLQGAYSDHEFKKGQFPVAELLASTSLSLPIWPGLTEKSVVRVIKSIHTFFK